MIRTIIGGILGFIGIVGFIFNFFVEWRVEGIVAALVWFAFGYFVFYCINPFHAVKSIFSFILGNIHLMILPLVYLFSEKERLELKEKWQKRKREQAFKKMTSEEREEVIQQRVREEAIAVKMAIEKAQKIESAAEANLEALEHLTGLSKAELKKIDQSVRDSFKNKS